jgi:hypothetical protein
VSVDEAAVLGLELVQVSAIHTFLLNSTEVLEQILARTPETR